MEEARFKDIIGLIMFLTSPEVFLLLSNIEAGDAIVIKNNIKTGYYRGEYIFVEGMKQFLGKELLVSRISGEKIFSEYCCFFIDWVEKIIKT